MGGGGGYGDLKGGINFHPKHLEGAIKIQLVLCIRHGGGGGGAIKTYFDNRCDLEKFLKE